MSRARRSRRRAERNLDGVERESVGAYVDQTAAAIRLPIDPADRDAVIEYMTGFLAMARAIAEHPLPDDVEPAPVFEP